MKTKSRINFQAIIQNYNVEKPREVGDKEMLYCKNCQHYELMQYGGIELFSNGRQVEIWNCLKSKSRLRYFN